MSSPALRFDALPQLPDCEPGPERVSSAEPDSGGAASDRQRLETLVLDHFDAVWRFLRRLGVPASGLEDAAQEVFAIAARRIAQVRPGSEKSFVFGTALRVASGSRRRRAIERSRHEPIADDAPSLASDPEQLVCERRAREALEELLTLLDEPAREVFVLFELEGFTFSEIAELLAIPRGTVASRLRRARDELMSGGRRLRAKTKAFVATTGAGAPGATLLGVAAKWLAIGAFAGGALTSATAALPQARSAAPVPELHSITSQLTSPASPVGRLSSRPEPPAARAPVAPPFSRFPSRMPRRAQGTVLIGKPALR